MHCAALLLAFVALASARPHSPARAGDACEPRTIFCADGDGRSARFLKCVRGRLIEGFCTQNSVCVGSKGTTLFCAADDTSGTGATTSTTTVSPTPPAMQSQPGSQPDSQPDAAAESEDPEDSEESEEPEEPRAQSTPPGMFRAAQPSSTASKHHPTVAEDAVLDIPPAATGAEKENVLEAGQVVPIIASVIFSQHPELFDHGASASRPAATPPLPPVHQTAAPRKGIDTCRPGSFFCADHGAQPGYFACDAVGLPLPASCGANNVCYQFGRSILCDKVGRTAHVDGMFA
ncbi:hypothetical protein H4R18_003930 [Coemansia javaensis]|uniref:Carbohydrate-binding module family 19 domain-containing protein n=1 Tax=Coemansia javaensis TaxID=2761396 RepID=A0A9W8LFL0_9FUNG|nr:hypothetical protein H4R18_003930 [Coemansia javaensis]